MIGGPNLLGLLFPCVYTVIYRPKGILVVRETYLVSLPLFCLEFDDQFTLLKQGAVNPNYPVLGVVISTKEERGGAVRRHMLATLKEPVPPPPGEHA